MSNNQKPQSKTEAIRWANDYMPGMSNAKIKKYCFDNWGIVVESNLIHETLGSEASRRNTRGESIKKKLAESYVARIGDYREALRLLRAVRKGG